MRYPKLKFNMLRAYFGRPYVIDLEDRPGVITVYDPGMKAAYIEADENGFKATLNIFTTNTTALRAFLWDLGMDWNETTDFELFTGLYQQADPDMCKLLFGDLDFRGFQKYEKHDVQNGESKIVLYNKDADVMIDEDVYQHIHQYLQALFNVQIEEEFTDDPYLKDWWVLKDKRDEEIRKLLHKDEANSIQSLISACVNHPGFKYNLHEVEEMGVAQFYDSVRRLQVYESSKALMNGAYCGMADLSKVPKEQFDFMRNINS